MPNCCFQNQIISKIWTAPSVSEIKSQIRIADMRLGSINGTKGFLYEEYQCEANTPKDRFKEIQLKTNQMECERLQIQIKDLREGTGGLGKRYDCSLQHHAERKGYSGSVRISSGSDCPACGAGACF
ncbi:MAG: hypothetical protein ACLU3I_07015 [Acutalibacteraceae bacterium]